jgi:glycosyltransferase involved in cell wall biosynthesis
MFTFIIPSVRKGSLAYAVDSVVNQTFPYWEAIVCGDGIAVPNFSDNRVKSIMAPRHGDASAIRMIAARHTKNPWIVFLDDDDWVAPDYLDRFIPFVSDNDIIISKMLNYGNQIPSGHFIEHGNVGISFAVKTEVLLENPLPPAPSEDYVFLKRMEGLGYKIAYTDYCGYFVRKYQYDPSFISTI